MGLAGTGPPHHRHPDWRIKADLVAGHKCWLILSHTVGIRRLAPSPLTGSQVGGVWQRTLPSSASNDCGGGGSREDTLSLVSPPGVLLRTPWTQAFASGSLCPLPNASLLT